VAFGGDTIRVKAGTYPSPQSLGGSKTPIITVIGEDGAQVINSGTGTSSGLSLQGNVIVRNVNVGGTLPYVNFVNSNNTWENSRLLAATALRSANQPIEFPGYAGNLIANSTLRNVVVELQKASSPHHLEMIRIDGNVNGVLIDRVTFERCVDGAGYIGCGSGHIFITTPSTTTIDPTNIVIRNSVFKGTAFFGIQIHSNVDCHNITLAYNTSVNDTVNWGCANRSNIQLIGNVAPRPQTCLSGTTYTRNVWQHSVGSPCGTDTLVIGPNYSLSALGLDANLRPMSGSRVISAGESSYCAGALGGVDRDGKARPNGSSCTAGAYEFGSASVAAPSAPSNLRIVQ
jgi:hypothetical protein